MQKLYGLGFSRLANGQVAYFGRAAAAQRDGLQFILLAENDEQLNWLWARLNPNLALEPAAVYDCGITHAGSLRRVLAKDPAREDGAAAFENPRDQKLRRLEQALIDVLKDSDGAVPPVVHQALMWATNRLTTNLTGSGISHDHEMAATEVSANPAE